MRRLPGTELDRLFGPDVRQRSLHRVPLHPDESPARRYRGSVPGHAHGRERPDAERRVQEGERDAVGDRAERFGGVDASLEEFRNVAQPFRGSETEFTDQSDGRAKECDVPAQGVGAHRGPYVPVGFSASNRGSPEEAPASEPPS